MKTTPIFAVRLTAALRVKAFVAKDPTRYYLSGVHISPAPAGGAICAATDGHRLGVRHDPNGFCAEDAIIRIPNEIKMPPKLVISPWLVGAKTDNGHGHISVVDARGSREEDTAEAAMARVDDCTIRIGRAFIDATFPDWRRVIPSPSERDVVRGFNAEYVRGFGNCLSLRGADEASAHLVQIATEPEFLGVLMPMRVESKAELPAWLAQPEAPPKRKKAA